MEYKVTLFGNGIYKEIELPEDMEGSLLIGTTPDCQIRFNRDNFFDDFEISLMKKNQGWTAACRNTVYFQTEQAVKQYFLILKHGDRIHVQYESTGVELFKMEFMLDYEREIRPYRYCADISRVSRLTVGGGPDCEIRIEDSLTGQDRLHLMRGDGGYHLDASDSRYGVLVNGFKAGSPSVFLPFENFFALGGYGFYITDRELYFTDHDRIHTGFPVRHVTVGNGVFQYPKFIRNVRQQYQVPDTAIEVLAPKQKPQAPKKNLLMTIVPVIASLALIVILRGIMGGGGSFILYSAAMMAMGGVMSVWNFLNDGKEYKMAIAAREESYNAYIALKEEQIGQLRDKELAILKNRYLSTQEDLALAGQFDARLYERRPQDEDFLEVYLGQGVIPSGCQVKYREQEYKDTDDEFQDYPAMLHDKYQFLSGGPVTMKLGQMNAAGISGSRGRLYQITKNMALDLCIRQFYQDVKLYFILDPDDARLFSWLRWMKHTWNDVIASRNFMYDDESAKKVLEVLYSELAQRETMKEKEINTLCQVVIFVYRSEKLMLHPVSRYIDKARSLGFHFVFLEERREYLPQGVDQLITLSEQDFSGILQDTLDGERQQQFYYPHVSTEEAAAAALRLACVQVDDVSLESTLTHNISLFRLMGILSASELDLKTRWEKSKIYESMAAPVGVQSGDEIVYLDLHEKAHGPHGLVAGTTGSGKSELLQTYILSMASLFHPTEVGFVIIDFKGGGMVNQFKELPHLIGAITDIDGREITRSLLSIKAELDKRKELFAQSGVSHIDQYIQLYKKHEVSIPLPHLILIVDEFAELKMDQPEFMKELISAARIGRSLGVHLILATQKPSGVVDSQIWSNSRFKLCLKVQGKEDSNEVLHSPLAAEIKEPGRAYLQVGNNEIFTLFQSAYSGAPVNVDDNSRRYVISRIDLGGKRTVIYEKKPGKVQGKKETQLDALVKYIGDYCRKEHIDRLPGICLPPLPQRLTCPVNQKKADLSGTRIPLGIFDDPVHQRQEEISINLLDGHVLIVGAAQTGKTNLLQLMLRQIACQYSPEQTSVYIMDFGSMALKLFEGLNHVGGVALASEDEKIKNLLKLLKKAMKKRKEIFSSIGITSFASYREAGYTDLPHIILMIDNFLALKELYPDHEEDLLNLCREGISLGITLVVTSIQTSGISYRYLSNMPGRICLYCNQRDEYSSMFDKCRMEPKNVPGRGLIAEDKEVYEFQSYLAFDGEKEIERAKQMKEMIRETDNLYEGRQAAPIPMVPEVLRQEALEKLCTEKDESGYRIPVGVDYEDVEVLSLDLASQNVLAVSGQERGGKSNFISLILGHLYRKMFLTPVSVYLLDDGRKGWKPYEDWGIVERYSLNPDDILEYVEEIHSILAERYQRTMEDGQTLDGQEPLLLLLVDNQEAVLALGKNPAAMKQYKEITGKFKNCRVCVIYAGLEDAAIGFSGPEVLKMLKEQRNLMYFGNLSALKLLDVPNPALRYYKKEITPGDAYYISGSSVLKVKTALAGGEE